ncbi:hypothetical protein FQN54_006065 [Arachnomyces sp. PD_36]|nr:hypothetical protein FQN54_006065 [Arachnomyces sp. PD_36]
MAYDDDDYFIPLEDQRVFGAGIKRKRVQFVPSTDPNLSTTSEPEKAPSSSVGDTYLSIVLKRSKSEPAEQDKSTKDRDSTSSGPEPAPDGDHTDPLPVETETEPRSSSQPAPTTTTPSTCEICNLPLHSTTSNTSHHDTSIAHQVCLQHSHPPSHLDRSRSGLKYLSSYGWDPDSRLGLGARGEGIRQPLKGKVKNDTVGLGVPEKGEGWVRERRKAKEREETPLNAKEVRRREVEGRKKGERLREMFYRNDDVEKYLGGG